METEGKFHASKSLKSIAVEADMLRNCQYMVQIRTVNLLNASDSHTNSSIKAMYGALIEFMTFSFQP
jgi:hypothetical protein